MALQRWSLLAACAAFAAAAGCASLAPGHRRPAAPVPEAWPSGPAYPAPAGAPGEKSSADVPWREFFADERLRALISLALENNRDLRVALLAVERSQAQYRIQRASLAPRLDASAGANLQRVPEGLSGAGAATTLHQYTVGLGLASYELDLFGRVRNLKDAALEQYLATGHAQRSVQISLVSQVAAAWLSLAADRERLELARETLAGQEEYHRLVRLRFEAGVSSALELNQARTSVETARADIARFTGLVAQDENALTLAVGSPVPAGLLPSSLTDRLTALQEIPPGLPSDVLLRRPDILQAESRLKAASANIGAARAALFPRITLISSAGLGSDELGGLFKSGSSSWSFVPRVSLPIFDGGANRAGLKTAKVDREIAVAQYEKAIQTAFREVADALALRGTIGDQLAAQQALADAAGETERLSRARYEKGVDGFLAVLDSQRARYAAMQGLIATRLALLVNQATLYKALGGGADN